MSTDVEVGTGTAVAEAGTREIAKREPLDIEGLLHLAIEKDGAIEVIERLRDMRNDELAREAEREFQAAFGEFKRRCPPIPRDKVGASFVDKAGVRHVTKYAPLDTIQPIVDPLLFELGFHYRWSNKATSDSVMTTCVLKHAGGHEETSSMTLPVSGPPKSSTTQAHSGTRTFAKRITLEDVLGLATVDDLDGADGDAGDAIDESQLAEIRSLILRKQTTEAKLLEFAGVDAWENLPLERFDMVVKLLKSKKDR